MFFFGASWLACMFNLFAGKSCQPSRDDDGEICCCRSGDDCNEEIKVNCFLLARMAFRQNASLSSSEVVMLAKEKCKIVRPTFTDTSTAVIEISATTTLATIGSATSSQSTMNSVTSAATIPTSQATSDVMPVSPFPYKLYCQL